MLRIGVGLPTLETGTTGRFLVDWARLADAGPFSSLTVRDRVVDAAKEPLIALATAAGVTTRIHLEANVIIGPTRETTLLARQAASIDALSGGRLTMGLGVGYRQDDYLATGFPFHERVARLDAQLPVLRRLWSGEPAGPGLGPVGPAPARPGGPELLIGGHVPAVAARIARWGDGYLASVGGDERDQARMLALWALIPQAWSAAGRPGTPRLVTGAYFALGPAAEQEADRYLHANYGFKPGVAERMRRTVPTTPAAVARKIREQADLGADEFILLSCVEDITALRALTNVLKAEGLDR